MNVSIYVRMYIHGYVRTKFLRTYVCIHIYTCVNMYVLTYLYVSMYEYTYIYIYLCTKV